MNYCDNAQCRLFVIILVVFLLYLTITLLLITSFSFLNVPVVNV